MHVVKKLQGRYAKLWRNSIDGICLLWSNMKFIYNKLDVYNIVLQVRLTKFPDHKQTSIVELMTLILRSVIADFWIKGLDYFITIVLKIIISMSNSKLYLKSKGRKVPHLYNCEKKLLSPSFASGKYPSACVVVRRQSLVGIYTCIMSHKMRYYSEINRSKYNAWMNEWIKMLWMNR